jgi:hypothetical protein
VLSVQAANSSKPPPLPPSTGSRSSHDTAEQNCGRITLFEGYFYLYIFLALCQTLQQVDKYIKSLDKDLARKEYAGQKRYKIKYKK